MRGRLTSGRVLLGISGLVRGTGNSAGMVALYVLSVLRVRRATVVRHALSDAGGTSVQTHTSLSLQCFPSLLVLKVFVCLMATDEKLLVAFNLPIHCKCNGLWFLL